MFRRRLQCYALPILTAIYLLAALPTVWAQNALPVIVTFSGDPTAITVDAAESGTVEITLSWHAIHVGEDMRLVLQQRSLGAWAAVVPEDEALPAAGTRTITIQHPLDFSPPTYRLALVSSDDQLIDERFLVIPYESPPDLTPQIDLFTASTPTVTGEALSDGSARVSVSWEVSNRLPTSNLIFEQVQGESEAVPVELPRGNLWIGSRGDGVVAPVPPAFGSILRLRLRVIDVLTEQVYDEAEVEVLVAGTTSAALPIATETPLVLTEETDAGIPANCSFSAVDVPLTGTPDDGCDTFHDPRTGAITRVVSFSLDNPNPTAGRPVTVSWEVEGAQFALLEVYDPDQLAQGGLPGPAQVVLDGLDTAGSTTVTLPASMSSGARFILWAANISTEARSPSFLYDRLAYRIIDTGEGARLSTNAEISAFIALPAAVAPGGEVTLSWSLSGADAALIELFNRADNQSAGVFEDLPATGSANILIPDTFTQGARFVLWAADRAPDGTFIRLVQREVEVLPE